MEVIACIQMRDDAPQAIAYVSEKYTMKITVTENAETPPMDDAFKAKIASAREVLKNGTLHLPETQKFCEIASDLLFLAIPLANISKNDGALDSCMCNDKDTAYFLKKSVYKVLRGLEVDEIQIVTRESFDTLANATGFATVYEADNVEQVAEAVTKKIKVDSDPVITLAPEPNTLNMVALKKKK